MGRSDFADVRQKWVFRMQRFARCGMTVSAFCELERVSVAAFYQWRKKLAQSADRVVIPAEVQAGRVQPKLPKAVSGFVPVKLLQSAAIEVRLANGVSLSIPGDNLEALRQALTMVCQLPAVPRPGREEQSC